MIAFRSARICSLCLALVLCAVAPWKATAHPMGNFSINHYAKLKLSDRTVSVLYIVDMAEIPTYQEVRQQSLVPHGEDPSVASYLKTQQRVLGQGLLLECDGKAVPLEPVSHQAVFSDGAGGLPTMKLRFAYRGLLPKLGGSHRLSYTDRNFGERTGWKEIVVLGDGAEIVSSSAPDKDRSNELAVYSSDLLNSPPQQLSALVAFRNTGAAAVETAVEKAVVSPTAPHTAASARSALPIAPVLTAMPAETERTLPIQTPAKAPASNTPRSKFTDLIASQGQLSLWILLTAALLAAGFGAMHALEPGHGKTLVAAYLVGSRGTAKHAVLLGIVVTAAHTAGVFALGIVTLFLSRYIVPAQLYPWLGAISGISVAAVGVLMVLRHLTGETGEHAHVPGEQHSHWFQVLTKKPQAVETGGAVANSVSLRELCALGVTGGIIPCPAALVVLLSAFSLHRIGFGLFLITAFSVGLASVLVTVGLLMVYTKRFLSTYVSTGRSWARYLPLVSSALMILLGLGIAISAFGAAPLSLLSSAKDTLVPILSVTLLGLFLGIRHSTDSDHVVAMSTLVTRQGSIRGCTTMGMLWGLGHTITIFLVGSAIILFGVVIPPRIGLSMEFSVALMLILLGVLNLSGVLKKITDRFTPASVRESATEASKAGTPKLGLFYTVRPLFIGLVHGLAGSAAVALLVLSTIRNPLWATAYLLVFGFGTMAGMMLMTAAISLPLLYTKSRFNKLTGHLTMASGIISVAFGLFLVFQIGFVDGLFTSQVHWTPH